MRKSQQTEGGPRPQPPWDSSAEGARGQLQPGPFQKDPPHLRLHLRPGRSKASGEVHGPRTPGPQARCWPRPGPGSPRPHCDLTPSRGKRSEPGSPLQVPLGPPRPNPGAAWRRGWQQVESRNPRKREGEGPCLLGRQGAWGLEGGSRLHLSRGLAGQLEVPGGSPELRAWPERQATSPDP